MVFAWWNLCIIRPYCAADGGAGGGTEDVHFLKQFGLGEPWVMSVKTHPHDVAVSGCNVMGVMSWTGKSDVYQQLFAGLSLPALCCSSGAPRVAVPCSLLSHSPITRRANRRTCSRSGRSARRAGPNAAGLLFVLSKHTFYKRFHFFFVSASL